MGAMPVSALLLAAGIGTRLRPLTDIFPKCLMPIDGRPLLGLWFELLCSAGIDDIIVNTHHHADFVQEFIRKSPYANHTQITYEKTLLGTAGTLIANYKKFKNDTIMLVHADNLSAFDVKAFVQAHKARPKHTVMTMMTFNAEVPQQCGIVELDKDDVVTAFHEKVANPPGTRANAAVYLLERSVIREMEEKGISDFSTEVLPHLRGKIFTYHNARYHRDIGTPESLARAQHEWPDVAPASAGTKMDPWYGLLKAHPKQAEALQKVLKTL